jgi:hypothetical protein
MLGFISDFIRVLGGRKFLLAIGIIAIATYVQLNSDKGVTTEFAAMMVTILGLFNVTNAVTSRDYLSSRQPETRVVDHTDDLTKIKESVVASSQTVQNLHSFLTSLVNAAKPGGQNVHTNSSAPR